MKDRKAILLAVAAYFFTSAAHGAALTTAFTYQGRLNDGGAPANGSYDLTFQLFDAATNGTNVGVTVTNMNVAVTDGLFTTSLDFGAGVFDGNARWLEISARTNGAGVFTALSPRQALPPTPYALFASAAATANAVVANSITPTQLRTPNPPSNGLVLSFNGTSLVWTNASTIASAWTLNGNAATTPGVNFLGTTDNQPLELSVNGQRAMRIEPASQGANVILGYASNYISPGVFGATIGGGGGLPAPAPNFISADSATIGGGFNNHILAQAFMSTIGGGGFNSIEFKAPVATISGGYGNTNRANGATISGGTGNLIETNAHHANIAGGNGNTIRADGATIGGGYVHTIGLDALNATIAGGLQNTLSDYTYGSVIGGGSYNIVFSNSYDVVISGGMRNYAAGTRATVGGGIDNVIQNAAYASTIGGGSLNLISTDAQYALIGGGSNNTIQSNAVTSVVSGGSQNSIQIGASVSTIGGGGGNTIQTNANYSTIAGGIDNAIQSIAFGSTISGGRNNTIENDAENSSIGGGLQNTIRSNAFRSTVSGGEVNTIGSSASASVIAGGDHNTIHTGANQSTIAGGTFNTIGTNAVRSTISGGVNNAIFVGAELSTIGGGQENHIQAFAYRSIIGGGNVNTVEDSAYSSTISGGEYNIVRTNAMFGVIPGGQFCTVAGSYGFAAGFHANVKHNGAFVWADSSGFFDFPSSQTNEFAVRATGGVRFVSAIDTGGVPAAGVSLSAGGGSWSSLSDRNAKENLQPVDGRTVLEKVSTLPLATWNYKSQDTKVRHIGPMAQDFAAAFDVGENETTITTIDADGVALAAIQGLNRKVEEQKTALKERDEKISALEERLNTLERLVSSLTPRPETSHP